MTTRSLHEKPTHLTSVSGLSKYRLTMRDLLVRLVSPSTEHLTDEQWLLYMRSLLTSFFRNEHLLGGNVNLFKLLQITDSDLTKPN